MNTLNKFMVSSHFKSGEVVILNPPFYDKPISKEDGLNLIAYLALLLGISEEEFSIACKEIGNA